MSRTEVNSRYSIKWGRDLQVNINIQISIFTRPGYNLTLFVLGGKGQICPLLSYFNILPKLKL